MKVVRLTFEMVIQDDSPVEEWAYNSLYDQLEDDESIEDFDYQILQLNA